MLKSVGSPSPSSCALAAPIETFLANAFLLSYPQDLGSNPRFYTTSYPHVFSSTSQAAWFLHIIEGQMVSFCTLFPIEWQWKGQTIRGACIGSVATHPQHRRKGFATKVLLKAETFAKEMGYSFSFVFAPPGPPYEQVGYRGGGQEILIETCGSSEPTYLKTLTLKWGLMREMDLNTWFDFYHKYKHPTESHIAKSVLQSLTEIPQCQLITAWRGIELVAMAFHGKGIDYQNVFHGFVAKDEATLMNFYNLLPPGKLAALGPWGHLAEKKPVIVSPLYLYKILNPFDGLESLLKNGLFYPYSLISA